MSRSLSVRKKMNNRLREDAKDGKVTLVTKRFTPSTCSNVNQPRTLLISLPKLNFMKEKGSCD